MPYQSIGDFPINFMMNQFDLSNWYDNDELDLYESIDLIKDYDDDMTDRLSAVVSFYRWAMERFVSNLDWQQR